jgi:hypothetical protein
MQEDMPQESESSPESSSTGEGEEGNISQGYLITLTVTPDGYSVSDPEPLPAAPSDQSEEQGESDEETVPDLTTAIKHILAVVKANPLGESEQEQFSAGLQ